MSKNMSLILKAVSALMKKEIQTDFCWLLLFTKTLTTTSNVCCSLELKKTTAISIPLKNSGIWEAYCGSEAYQKISEYSGYNLKQLDRKKH
jgi:hypothetical protein